MKAIGALLLLMTLSSVQAEEATDCPASPELNSDRTMLLVSASRRYFDLNDEEMRAALASDLDKAGVIAEEMAGLLTSSDSIPLTQVATMAGERYPDRTPSLLAAILQTRDWLDYDNPEALIDELVTALAETSPDNAAALGEIGEAYLGSNPAKSTSARCALERGTDAASHVLTAMGK